MSNPATPNTSASEPLRAQNTFHELSLDSLEGYQLNLALCGKSARHALFSDAFKRQSQGYDSLSVLRQHADQSDTDHPLLRAQYIDIKTYLPGDILVKVDRCAMANSLEVRVPLLDHHFVEWACQLPAHAKLKGRAQKRLFKNAMRGHIPGEILDRPKQGFAPPIADWLPGPLHRELDAALSGESLWDSELFDRTEINKLHQQHSAGLRDHSTVLWALLVFARFLENGYEAVH